MGNPYYQIQEGPCEVYVRDGLHRIIPAGRCAIVRPGVLKIFCIGGAFYRELKKEACDGVFHKPDAIDKINHLPKNWE